MLIYEYEAKEIFKKYQLPLQTNILLHRDDFKPQNWETLKNRITFSTMAVKAQILGGGRGKRGLIKIAHNIEECKQYASEILGRTDLKEGPVSRLMIEEGCNIEHEIYLSAVLDRSQKKILVMVSSEGGVDIEEVAKNSPEKISKLYFSVSEYIFPYHFFEILEKNGFIGKKKIQIAGILSKLVYILRNEDLLMVEINPFVFSKEEKPIVLDARVMLDSSAIFRHPDQMNLNSINENLGIYEKKAQENGLAYVQLEGNIGLISCGAGLSMASCDTINDKGGEPANFLDVGGGATPEKVEAALSILFDQAHIQGIVINVFGGITRCDDVAKGIIESLSKSTREIPVVVRLIGTNDKEGITILNQHQIAAFADMDPAIEALISQMAKKEETV